jgi:hypothetical protein
VKLNALNASAPKEQAFELTRTKGETSVVNDLAHAKPKETAPSSS